jgi:hypothetical protein
MYLYWCIQFNMLFLVFLFFRLATAADQSAVLFCVPHTLKITDGNVFNIIQDCLTNNFVRLANTSIIDTYVDAYDKAWAAKVASEQTDNDLFLSKHEMTLAMRDLRIRASRHIHAVESCSAISHRMPSAIVDTYTNEAQMMQQISDLWMHHIQVDLKRCFNILKQIIFKSHKYTAYHLQSLYIKYKHLLQDSEQQHVKEIERLQDMLNARQAIVEQVNT